LLAAAAFPVAAMAADLDSYPPTSYAAPAPSGWTVTLGAEARMLPSFPGSSRSVVRPVPLFDIRRAGTPRHFSSPRDGFGFGLFDTGNFRIGPTAKLRLPRKQSDDTKLTGLGDVNWAVELGLFAEYWPVELLRTRLEVRQGLGGHRGLVSDLTADVVIPVGQMTVSAGPRLTYVTAPANRPYFSIDAAQSLASGLPMFTAKGGVYSYGAGAQVRYEWTPRLATHVFAEYERLTGSAADSPLVVQRGSVNQVTAGIGATYAFDIPGVW
jgi:outer membrane protein